MLLNNDIIKDSQTETIRKGKKGCKEEEEALVADTGQEGKICNLPNTPALGCHGSSTDNIVFIARKR